MDFDNKTILITGLVVGSVIAMVTGYEQIALAIVSGLVGYLSKDANVVINHGLDDEDDESP